MPPASSAMNFEGREGYIPHGPLPTDEDGDGDWFSYPKSRGPGGGGSGFAPSSNVRFVPEHGGLVSRLLETGPRPGLSRNPAYTNAPWAISPAKYLMKNQMKIESESIRKAGSFAESGHGRTYRSRLALSHNSARRVLELRNAQQNREAAWREHTNRMNARFHADSMRAASFRSLEKRTTKQRLEGEVAQDGEPNRASLQAMGFGLEGALAASEDALLAQQQRHENDAREENLALMRAREAAPSPAWQQDRMRDTPMPPSFESPAQRMPPGYAEDARHKVMMSAFGAFDLGATGRIAPWDFEQASMHLNLGLAPSDVMAIAEKCSDAETGMIDYVSFAKAALA